MAVGGARSLRQELGTQLAQWQRNDQACHKQGLRELHSHDADARPGSDLITQHLDLP